MFVVLYGVALAMVAGGVFAAVTGWEILLLERGWSMVIAGATLATGGLVLGGLAAAAQALARRLDALGEAVRASARAQPTVFPKRPAPAEPAAEPAARAAPVPQPPDREIEPKIPSRIPSPTPREPLAPAGPAPVAALGIGGVAAEAVAPTVTRPAPEPVGGLPPIDLTKAPAAEPVAVPAAPADAGETAEEAEAPRAPEEEAAEEAPQRAPEPEETPAPDETAPAAAAAAGAGPGIEEPVLGRRERGRIEAEAEALARRFEETAIPFGASPSAEPGTSEGLAEPPSHALEEAASEAEPTDAPRAEEAQIGPSEQEAGAEPTEPPEPPVVVGTHVAGANRYVMYSDGSIEAETPDGRLLFASIDELKGYIASAGEDPSGTTQTGPR